MNRRKFLATAALAPLAARLGLSSSHGAAEPISSSSHWRRFEITTRVTLPDDAAASAQLWLPLAQTAGGYQTALDLHWNGTGQTHRLYDARYGAPILHTVWDAAAPNDKTLPNLEVVQTVATSERTASPLLPLTEAERRFWTTPTASAPIDGVVLATARYITAGQTEPRARLRAIYDWVIENTYRDPDTPGCGTGDIRKNLETSRLGGKCADINSLMVGLARAAGFPARDVYGLRVADSKYAPCLGRSGNVSKAQHCRCEVFLENEGWFPLDPADVRKVVLEQKLPLDSPEVRAHRERLFGSWEMNWIAYNSATDIELPGGGCQAAQPDFAFLMYPHALTPKGPAPCLDPAKFSYEITAKEI